MQGGRHPIRSTLAGSADEEPFADVISQLGEYFDGARRTFDVPLTLKGNAFELRVWQALCEIPYGETVSYGEIARVIGSPRPRVRSVWPTAATRWR